MMALPADDTDAPSPFTWGAGGARMTPEAIAAQRRVAEALAAKGTDYSPIRSAWQGAARVAQGLNAGLAEGRANRAEEANAAENTKMIAALLGGGGASTAATAPAASSAAVTPTPPPGSSVAPSASADRSAPSPAVAAAASTPTADSSGVTFYPDASASTPFEPSASDRDATIRTVYGEAANEPAVGQQAVASVIRNRSFDGGYGGDTPTAVVHAPNQFEPWNGGPATARMQALSPTDPKYQAIAKVVDAAYGTGGRAPDDPTEGKTMFYSPGAQAALGRPAPSWAKGDGQVIGGHTFYDDPEDSTAAKPVQVASADPAAIPSTAAPTQGYAVPGQGAASPAVAKVASALNGVNPAVLAAYTSPYASESTKKIAGLILANQLSQDKKAPIAVKAGETLIDPKTFQPVYSAPADEDKQPNSVREYEYYKKTLPPGTAAMPYDAWSTAKSRAGATNISTNVDMGSGQTYDKQLAEGLGKSHAALANGVEDAQSRARDIAAMQGAIDQIQKNGGSTGGMGQQQILDLKKTINAGAAGLGITTPFNESDISDKEFLTKFNRQIAGAQAKGAMGSRVTNFEMSNYLKANPGLDMSVTGNQRLIGIQGQIEQRNIAVGNAIRNATAEAISKGQKIDPVTVQKIITDYDAEHHVKDPVTGQDLTQSYALPEFQTQGTNPAMAADHAANVGKIRRYNPETGALE